MSPEQIRDIALDYALHIRTFLARNRLWAALYWLNSLRDLLIDRFSQLHRLPAYYAKGADRLPDEIQSRLHVTVPSTLEYSELSRAFSQLIPLLAGLIHDDTHLVELAAALPALTL